MSSDNIKFGKLFPVTVHNRDGSTCCGSIECDKRVGAQMYQRAKNQFMANAAQPLLNTYVTANKIVKINAETTQNIFFIFFIGFWLLMILITLFIFGAMCYGQNNMGSWFIVILLLIIIVPLLLLWWISSIYNNTFSNTKDHVQSIIGQDGCLKQITDAFPSIDCCDSSYSCNNTSCNSCTSYKSCDTTSNLSFCNPCSNTRYPTSCNTSSSNTSCNTSSSSSSSSCTTPSSYKTTTCKNSYDSLTDTDSTSNCTTDTAYGTCTDDN
jgi:hypothetical protein